ncbi:RNA methyltransferase [Fulvivirga ligni]|uniref:RNA methyltransferase n=1 Tax=Fulvivirga ligni TaxID=2904246 RepID=UPI001F2FD734|nr:RNA methyltransferase [Fulvivirga ligni]UII22090.1 RNA methyltransferase [Fulvivirga ligni]
MRKLANEELDRKTVEEFKESDKLPIVILLDNIRSMNNVGSAFRTSDAFLISKIYLGGITATPPHREITKTALGATESVEWEHAEDTGKLVQQLKEEGYTIIAIEQVDKSISLDSFTPDKNKKYCLVFGNEVFGVSEEVIKHSDMCIEIPQHGTKHSLNISVSLGITIWDFYNKLL